MRGRLLAFLLIPVIACAVWAAPHLFRAYHLQAGGRALDRALGIDDPVAWWYTAWDQVRDAQSLERAIVHLQRVDRAHAWRLLARAYAAQGSLLDSVRLLEQFTASRPENPLGHLELAAAYVLADRRLQEMAPVDLLEALPGALVSAPGLDRQIEYLPAGQATPYFYPTTFSLPPHFGDRPTLFVHAGAQVTYTVLLTQPLALCFGMGLYPESLGWGGDGATFEVWVDGSQVFLEHLTVELAREGWQERTLDLSDYRGRTVRLSLYTTPGPMGDVTADWAGWGEPRLEPVDAAAYRQVVRDRPWLAEWHKAQVSYADFVQARERARQKGSDDAALRWDGWARMIAPNRVWVPAPGPWA